MPRKTTSAYTIGDQAVSASPTPRPRRRTSAADVTPPAVVTPIKRTRKAAEPKAAAPTSKRAAKTVATKEVLPEPTGTLAIKRAARRALVEAAAAEGVRYRRNPDDASPKLIATGLTIEAAREAREMSIRELAQAIGISDGSMRRLETGFRNPTVETLEGIAEALGYDLVIEFAEPEPTSKRKRN